MDVAARPFRIAHLSDLHCGGPYFEAALLDRAISEIARSRSAASKYGPPQWRSERWAIRKGR